MDLDDFISTLIPKSTRKALKKRIKKEGLWRVIWAYLFGEEDIFADSKKKRKQEAQLNSTASPTQSSYKAKTPLDPLQRDLAQAHTYRAKIEAMAQAAEPDSIEQIRLQQLNDRVTEWVQTLDTIVSRTLAQGEDELLATERKKVPEAIKRLEKQLKETDDEKLRGKLTRTLENRRKQQAQLEQAANNRQIVELKVENTLAQLGIIYSQLHSGQYMAERSGYERLAAEINEEVDELGDYLVSLNELQSY